MNGNTHPAAGNGFRKHSLALAIGLTMAVTTVFGASMAQAATWDVSITNLTNGNHFTPLLVTAHDSGTHLFQAGMSASTALQAMAECGDLSGLTAIHAVDADTIENPAGGLLAPAATSTSAMLDTDGSSNTQLSVVAMMLPTNDAFVGLDNLHVPTAAGTYTYYLNAYDAGTEANSELLDTSGCAPGMAGIPGAPSGGDGVNGTGVSAADSNTNVHVHRGVLGDSDTMGGSSDLDSSIHRWQNPVAKITVTVTP